MSPVSAAIMQEPCDGCDNQGVLQATNLTILALRASVRFLTSTRGGRLRVWERMCYIHVDKPALAGGVHFPPIDFIGSVPRASRVVSVLRLATVLTSPL